MAHPSTNAHDGPLPQKLPTNDRATLGHHSLERQALGRVQAARFLDDRVEEREVAGLGPGDGEGERGGVEFGAQTVQRGWVPQEEVDGRAQEDGGCVGAGEDIGGRPDGEGSAWLG